MLQPSRAMYSISYISWLQLAAEYGGCSQSIFTSPLMFHGPSFIVSTMQEETTPIFKRLWYDWTQQQPGIEPRNPLGQSWVPPLVAFYDQQGLLRTYSLPGGSIRSPHPGSPRALR